MLPDTGLPRDITAHAKTRIGTPPNPILVQIASITEVGHSAFQLLNVRQTRIDRADLAGLIEAGVEDEEESEPIPRYPRSTLSLELSDGHRTIKAMEYRKMTGLELGVTPLGCKLMLKNVLAVQGIAFLEPNTVDIFQGSELEEQEAHQDFNFARDLRRKLGLPDPDPEAERPHPESTLVNPTNPATGPAPRPRHSSPPAATLAPRPPSRQAADESIDYFDGDDELDEAYLEELAAIEQRHLSQEQGASRSNAATNTKEEEEYYGLDSDIEMEIIDIPPLPRTAASRPSTQRTVGSQPQRGTQEEVIEISD
ncbi:hypothetical protein FRB90_010860 [Tulasnella sp. 427]|nr:hypothetical protein FRB90_010860 [Tulasnella sp. 427]